MTTVPPYCGLPAALFEGVVVDVVPQPASSMLADSTTPEASAIFFEAICFKRIPPKCQTNEMPYVLLVSCSTSKGQIPPKSRQGPKLSCNKNCDRKLPVDLFGKISRQYSEYIAHYIYIILCTHQIYHTLGAKAKGFAKKYQRTGPASRPLQLGHLD